MSVVRNGIFLYSLLYTPIIYVILFFLSSSNYEKKISWRAILSKCMNDMKINFIEFNIKYVKLTKYQIYM